MVMMTTSINRTKSMVQNMIATKMETNMTTIIVMAWDIIVMVRNTKPIPMVMTETIIQTIIRNLIQIMIVTVQNIKHMDMIGRITTTAINHTKIHTQHMMAMEEMKIIDITTPTMIMAYMAINMAIITTVHMRNQTMIIMLPAMNTNNLRTQIVIQDMIMISINQMIITKAITRIMIIIKHQIAIMIVIYGTGIPVNSSNIIAYAVACIKYESICSFLFIFLDVLKSMMDSFPFTLAITSVLPATPK
jgi:hypothetical protein